MAVAVVIAFRVCTSIHLPVATVQATVSPAVADSGLPLASPHLWKREARLSVARAIPWDDNCPVSLYRKLEQS